jgi:hypothetical protein
VGKAGDEGSQGASGPSTAFAGDAAASNTPAITMAINAALIEAPLWGREIRRGEAAPEPVL